MLNQWISVALQSLMAPIFGLSFDSMRKPKKNAPPLSLDYSQPDMTLVSLLGAVYSNVIGFTVLFLWRKFNMEKSIYKTSRVFIAMMFCLIIPIIIFLDKLTRDKGDISPIFIISMGGAIAILILLVFLQLNQLEKDEAENELKMLKQQAELERQFIKILKPDVRKRQKSATITTTIFLPYWDSFIWEILTKPGML